MLDELRRWWNSWELRCPKCGSNKVEIVPHTLGAFGCRACGWLGS